MQYYWIKLYHEILDDPGIATLQDRLWRRTIELFLLAGKLGGKEKTGILPGTKQLAWMLRVDEKELEKELEEISQLGMIRKHEGGWLVVNFNKRQGATSSTERSKEFRQRERHQQYVGENQNENATNAQRFDLQKQKQNKNKNKKQNTETESESEPLPVVVNSTDVGSVFRSYENEIGLITPIIAEKIKDYIEGDKVNIKWIIDAIEIAAKQNKRSFSYAEAILKRWIAQGFQDLGGKRENGRPKGGTSKEERKKFFEEWGIETHSDLELEDEEEEESRT